MMKQRRNKNKFPLCKKGEIYFANLNPVSGSEQGGIRPVLVVQNNIGNRFSSTVIVAAITMATKEELPVHLKLCQNYLEYWKFGESLEYSIILFEQIRTIDKWRLQERIGRFKDEHMCTVDSMLMKTFGVKEVVKSGRQD